MNSAIRMLISCALAVGAIAGARAVSLSDCPEVGWGKDMEGNNVMFHYLEIPGYDVRVKSIPPRLLLFGKKESLLYDTESLELIRKVKIKSGLTPRTITDKGYLTKVENPMKTRFTFFNYDGKKIWENKKAPVMFDTNKSVVIFNDDSQGKKVFALDMESGQPLWKMKIKSKQEDVWPDAFWPDVDDKYAYLTADSLIRLDVRTGETFKRPFNSGKRYFGMKSNWLERGDSLFIADADSLYCFNFDLNKIWSTALPKDAGSRSKIRIKDDKIYLLNLSYAFSEPFYIFTTGSLLLDLIMSEAFSETEVRKSGKPFAAVYDIKDGHEVSLTMPSDFDKKTTQGCYSDDGAIYWQSGRDIYRTDEGKNEVRKIEWKPVTKVVATKDTYNYALLDSVKYIKDGRLETVRTDADHFVVLVYGKDINVVTPEGKVELTLKPEEVYYHRRNGCYQDSEKDGMARNYVIADEATGEIECQIRISGDVWVDKAGNIFVLTNNALGVRTAKERRIKSDGKPKED